MVLAVLVLSVVCTEVSGRLRRGEGDELAQCNCDCCSTVRRLPEESEAGVKVKCAPSQDHSSDECSQQCQPPAGDRLLHIRGNVLDYQRYCFFECKPAEGPSAPVSTQCIALDLKDIEKTEDNGHARDPAIIYQAAQHKAALVLAKKQPTTKEAKIEALKGIEQSGSEGSEAFPRSQIYSRNRGKDAAKHE